MRNCIKGESADDAAMAENAAEACKAKDAAAATG